MSEIARLLLQLAVIVLVARVFGFIFRKIRQPQVIGEMFAGIVLGPSLLGLVAPSIMAALFPLASLKYLNALSQIGLMLFMFLVGLGVNLTELKKHGHAAVLVSHVSITAPFVLAVSLALFLYPRFSDSSISFVSFALFLGAAMSITAFPVLARILAERNMLYSRLGTVAISCAAVDDVTGWCVLAYIVMVVRAQPGSSRLWLTFGGSLAFVAIMVLGGSRVFRQFLLLFEKRGQLSNNVLAGILLLLLGSALATEWLGVHLLFGAFLMGVVMPKDRIFVKYLTTKFEFLPSALLLPTFFALTGLRTSVTLLRGSVLYCMLIISVAILGKMGGSMLAARLSGMSRREAAGIGVLMNTRGLMELVILNIGRDINVISPALFSVMVVMALFTTFMTSPLLEWICPAHMVVGEAPRMRAKGESSQDTVMLTG